MPSNITDCKSAGNTTSVVVCADSSWETIHSDQIPPNVNYLLVANTNITTISRDSFSSKAIMILHMTYNPLERIESEGRILFSIMLIHSYAINCEICCKAPCTFRAWDLLATAVSSIANILYCISKIFILGKF